MNVFRYSLMAGILGTSGLDKIIDKLVLSVLMADKKKKRDKIGAYGILGVF